MTNYAFYPKTMKSSSKLSALALVSSLALFAPLEDAHALTIDFDTFIAGAEITGPVTLATLTATQVGTDVEIVFTNTWDYASSFDTELSFGYLPADLTVGLTNVSGVAVTAFQNTGSFVDAGNTFDMAVRWGTGGGPSGDRLEFGDTSTFLLTGADLNLMFGGSGRDPFAMIHVQGIEPGFDCGDEGGICTSAKYGGSEVPIPAAAWLFGSGLIGLAGIARKRKAS